jgi:hypothetical protein
MTVYIATILTDWELFLEILSDVWSGKSVLDVELAIVHSDIAVEAPELSNGVSP